MLVVSFLFVGREGRETDITTCWKPWSRASSSADHPCSGARWWQDSTSPPQRAASLSGAVAPSCMQACFLFPRAARCRHPPNVPKLQDKKKNNSSFLLARILNRHMHMLSADHVSSNADLRGAIHMLDVGARESRTLGSSAACFSYHGQRSHPGESRAAAWC